MVVIKRSKGPDPTKAGFPKIRRVHLVSNVTAVTQQQLKKKAKQETQVFEDRITLKEAIDLTETAGKTEAELRAALEDGTVISSRAANGIRYQISVKSLNDWLAT
jgi:hypothetical protein